MKIEKVNYERLIKLVEPNETCDKDGEFKQDAVIQYMSKYRGYFLALVRGCRILGIEYVPTGDHPVLGSAEERRRMAADDDLSVEDHLPEFIELFKEIVYNLEIKAELGDIYKLKANW